MFRKRSALLPKILIGICEILPRVDVRATYDMYYRHFILWAIIVGLFVKFAYVRYLMRLSWSRGTVADIAMNSASSLLNLIAFPVAYLVWTLPRLALDRVFGTDNTAPVNWVALLLIIAMISAVSDAFVLRFLFKQRIGQKRFWLLYVANVVCVGVAACGMGIYGVAHPPTA
jgi:hypothetical protein